MSYTTPPTHIYMLPPPDVPDIFVEGWCVCVWVVEASTSIKAEVEVKVVPDYTKLFTTRQYQWWMVKYDNDQNLKKWHFIPHLQNMSIYMWNTGFPWRFRVAGRGHERTNVLETMKTCPESLVRMSDILYTFHNMFEVKLFSLKKSQFWIFLVGWGPQGSYFRLKWWP